MCVDPASHTVPKMHNAYATGVVFKIFNLTTNNVPTKCRKNPIQTLKNFKIFLVAFITRVTRMKTKLYAIGGKISTSFR